MDTLSNKSSRISAPEGYQEIPLGWGDGENIYVYMNPDLPSQPVYIGSDKNYKSTQRSKTIAFETNNTNGATSVANLNIIQAATVVNSITYYAEFTQGDQVTSQELNTTSNSKELPLTTGDTPIILRVYAIANINDGEEIKTYLPLGPLGIMLSNPYNNIQITINISDKTKAEITVKSPASGSSDSLYITIPTLETPMSPLDVDAPQMRFPLTLIQAENTYEVSYQNFQVKINNETASNTYRVPLKGAQLNYVASYEEVRTYATGSITRVTHSSTNNPEEFDIQWTPRPDSGASSDRVNLDGFTLNVTEKHEITVGVTTLGSITIDPLIRDTGISVFTGDVTQERNWINIIVNIIDVGKHSSFLWFYHDISEASEPGKEIIVEGLSGGRSSSLTVPAKGLTDQSCFSASLYLNVRLESGRITIIQVVKSTNDTVNQHWYEVDLTTGDVIDTLNVGALMFLVLEDVQGEDNITNTGGSVFSNGMGIEIPSLGTTLQPNNRLMGSVSLKINDRIKATKYSISTIDITQEKNVFKATKVNSFDYTYPNIPAKGGTIYFDKFILSMDGTWTSGETQTGLIFSDRKNAKNSYLLPNYSIKMHLDEFVDESNISPDVIPIDVIFSMIDYLIPPSSSVDDDTMAITYPKRSVGNKRIVSSQVYKVATLSIYIQDSLGNNLYIDGTTDISIDPNRVRVIDIADIHWLDSWNTGNYFMPAIGMDITEQIMLSMSCSLQVTFDSEEDPDTAVMGLNMWGRFVDGTGGFINLDCTEDPDVHYNSIKIPLEWWKFKRATKLKDGSGITGIIGHPNSLDSFITDTSLDNKIVNIFKAKNLGVTDKSDSLNDNGSFTTPSGLLVAPGIAGISLSIPSHTDSESILVTQNGNSYEDNMSIQSTWSRYKNISWQANNGAGFLFSSKNNLIPTYYNTISKQWVEGISTGVFDKSKLFPYKFYFEVIYNSYYQLHVIMPKEGGTIYLRDFATVTSFRQSGFVDDASGFIEEGGNDFSFVNPDSVPELTIVGYPGLDSGMGKLPGPSLFGIKVEANTKGIYRRLGVSSNDYDINIYNNNNSNIGRGSVVTIKIDQEG